MKEPLLYRLVRFPLTSAFWLIFRPAIIGKNNIPESGRVILAGNHTGFLDCFIVACGTRRCVHFLAKDELTKGAFRHIFNGLGVIAVNRRGGAKNALLQTEKYLKEEKLIAVFPEGTINRSENTTLQFRKGAVRMASDTDTPIIPFAVSGRYKPFCKGLSITFMPPIKVGSDLTAANAELMSKVAEKLEVKEIQNEPKS